MPSLLAGLVGLFSGVAAYFALAPDEEEVAVGERLQAIRRRRQAQTPGFSTRVLVPVWKGLEALLARAAPRQRREELREELRRAGDPMRVETWTLVRVGAVVPGIVLFLLLPRAVLAALALVALGVRLPMFWLKSRQQAEARAFLKLLPDALDLLAISVEAGLSFDAALERVAAMFPAPLGPAFGRTLAEMRLGRARRDALGDLAASFSLPELRHLVAAVQQSEELGVGIGRTLRVQADALRVQRRQKAQEAALKTPVKLILPLVLFIFPTLFTVLLGPALLQFLSFIGQGHGL